MTGPVGGVAGAVAGLAATNDAMQGMIDAANRGQFRVTPEAGNELIRISEDFRDVKLPKMQADLARLTRRTPLGDSPAGQAIAEFNKLVAAGGDGRSYQEMITHLQERIPQLIEAIKKGIQLYQEVDEGNANFGVQA
ncbi:hypothetical protein ABT324_18345 [Saccharopolyspora sp. NPDC000359]|uniref:hypothetical protein n=1 Tax=Saccharopolyspora sp. NPDC000359 TaxID=3154251 RepID=UPI0033246B62